MKDMILVSTMLVLAAAFTGCGGDDEPGDAAGVAVSTSVQAIDAPAEGGTYSVTVTTTGAEWGAYSDQDFVSLITQGTTSQQGTLTVSVAQNPYTEQRTATVTVVSGTAA